MIVKCPTCCREYNVDSGKYVSEYTFRCPNCKSEILIRNSDGRSRQEINDFVYPQLADDIDVMNNRVRTTLTYLRKKSLIQNDGSDTKPKWTIK